MGLLRASFKLHPSLICGIILGLTHLGAMLCVISVDLRWLVAQIGLISYILAVFITNIRAYVLLTSNNAINAFGIGTDNKWYLMRKNRELFVTLPHGPIFMGRYLIIINFDRQKNWRPLVLPIWRDALSAEAWRNLRVLLKTRR